LQTANRNDKELRMSTILKATDWISPDEYLEGERSAEVRHEYVDGRVYAKAGASDDHNRIVGNIFAELHENLRGHRCEPFINDMKVKIPPAFADVYYYPDVLVACDPTDNARYFRERPTVIIEVLSPETERTDRREKAIAYRQIPTVEAYLLVEQERMAATILRRTEPGWQSDVIEGRGSILKLPGIGVEIPLERIYERTVVAGARASGG
jgi:Uma2 family endonuclease